MAVCLDIADLRDGCREPLSQLPTRHEDQRAPLTLAGQRHRQMLEAHSFRSSVRRKLEIACVRYAGVIRFCHQQSEASRAWLETGSRL